MLEIRNILVPIDFHQHSEALVDLALFMSQKLGATQVTFIHVMPQLPDYSDYKPDTLKQLEASFLAHAESKMTALMETVKGRVHGIDGVVVSGDAADAILAYAREQPADLLVIATHGSQGIEKVLLGSVADRVIKGAPCPTLVFNPFNKERGYEVCKPLSSCVQAV
jgi:nucleotide-binding universal stress UspA family protein